MLLQRNNSIEKHNAIRMPTAFSTPAGNWHTTLRWCRPHRAPNAVLHRLLVKDQETIKSQPPDSQQLHPPARNWHSSMCLYRIGHIALAMLFSAQQSRTKMPSNIFESPKTSHKLAHYHEHSPYRARMPFCRIRHRSERSANHPQGNSILHSLKHQPETGTLARAACGMRASTTSCSR